MRLSFGSLLLGLSVCLLASACQKANPTVTLLTGAVTPPASAPVTTVGIGRVTLGSDSASQTAGGYTLKGRVSSLEPSSGSAGGYTLRGTVRF